MNDKLTIIYNGDSWVFGSEIIDPLLSVSQIKDYELENDTYRVPKIFPTLLSDILNANCINLSWPADDNGTILNRTISYISSEYLAKGISTDNLLVIVGWSSPERTSFWYKDETISHHFRLWPNTPHFVTNEEREIWKLYIQYLWNSEEYMARYVMNVLQLQTFCIVNNIKWLMFNSFYQTPQKNITEWSDINVNDELAKLYCMGYQYSSNGQSNRMYLKLDYVSIWNQINPIRFYKKNEPNNTFKSFIDKNGANPIYNGWHPSPQSHKLWAEELIRYINENNLL